MSRTVVVLGFAVLLSVATLWAGGATLVSVRHWNETHDRIDAKRRAAKAACVGRYLDQDAMLRCQHLHDVRYVAEVNIAKATRAVIAAGPLLVLLTAALVMWRKARTKETARLERERSAARRTARPDPADRSPA